MQRHTDKDDSRSVSPSQRSSTGTQVEYATTVRKGHHLFLRTNKVSAISQDENASAGSSIRVDSTEDKESGDWVSILQDSTRDAKISFNVRPDLTRGLRFRDPTQEASYWDEISKTTRKSQIVVDLLVAFVCFLLMVEVQRDHAQLMLFVGIICSIYHVILAIRTAIKPFSGRGYSVTTFLITPILASLMMLSRNALKLDVTPIAMFQIVQVVAVLLEQGFLLVVAQMAIAMAAFFLGSVFYMDMADASMISLPLFLLMISTAAVRWFADVASRSRYHCICSMQQIENEAKKTYIQLQQILKNVFPQNVAMDLVSTCSSVPVHYRSENCVTICIWTQHGAGAKASKKSSFAFAQAIQRSVDSACNITGSEKIKYLGSRTLVVAGLFQKTSLSEGEQIKQAYNFVVEFVRAMERNTQAGDILMPHNNTRIKVYIQLSSVKGVILECMKKSFDLVYDSINTARMEQVCKKTKRLQSVFYVHMDDAFTQALNKTLGESVDEISWGVTGGASCTNDVFPRKLENDKVHMSGSARKLEDVLHDEPINGLQSFVDDREYVYSAENISQTRLQASILLFSCCLWAFAHFGLVSPSASDIYYGQGWLSLYLRIGITIPSLSAALLCQSSSGKSVGRAGAYGLLNIYRVSWAIYLLTTIYTSIDLVPLLNDQILSVGSYSMIWSEFIYCWFVVSSSVIFRQRHLWTLGLFWAISFAWTRYHIGVAMAFSGRNLILPLIQHAPTCFILGAFQNYRLSSAMHQTATATTLMTQKITNLIDKRQELEILLQSILPRTVFESVTSSDLRFQFDTIKHSCFLMISVFHDVVKTDSETDDAEILSGCLNSIDRLCESLHMTPCKTFGWSYLAMCERTSISESCTDGLRFAFQSVKYLKGQLEHSLRPDHQPAVRVGISSGSAYAGLLDGTRLSYDYHGRVVEECATLCQDDRGEILASESVKKEYGDNQEFDFHILAVKEELRSREVGVCYRVTMDEDVWANYMRQQEWLKDEKLTNLGATEVIFK